MLPKEKKNIGSLEKLGEELKKWNSFNRGKNTKTKEVLEMNGTIENLLEQKGAWMKRITGKRFFYFKWKIEVLQNEFILISIIK